MLGRIIEASARNLFLVLLLAAFVIAAGIYAVLHTPLDALPDLSDTQVIIYTEYPGQAPQVVEDQITYPLSTAMLGVPRSKVVRGFSFFGASFVYVIFEDGTDLYWARSRVLEYLNFAAGRLPTGVTPSLGPDATASAGSINMSCSAPSVLWRNCAPCRTGSSATSSPRRKASPKSPAWAASSSSTKVVVDPRKLQAYGIPLMRVSEVIRTSNRECRGRVVELAETEYMVRGQRLLAGRRRFGATGAQGRGRGAGAAARCGAGRDGTG